MPDSGSRAVILLSDGAGRVDANTQQKIKDWFDRMHISLYWIVLRQPGGISIFDPNFKPVEDQPLPPEIELYEFFKTLKTPFKAYEAEDPKSLQLAMNDINNREKKPIKYFEKIPAVYEEALLTFGKLYEIQVENQFAISAETKARFDEFSKKREQHKNSTRMARNMLYKEFGDSYFYYREFVYPNVIKPDIIYDDSDYPAI